MATGGGSETEAEVEPGADEIPVPIRFITTGESRRGEERRDEVESSRIVLGIVKAWSSEVECEEKFRFSIVE